MNDLRGLWRGKSVDPEEWIEGYFAGYFLNERGENTPHILRSDNNDLEEVIPETIGECTTQPDKHGNLIFEGDVVRFREWSKGSMCWIGKVHFENLSFVVSGSPNEEVNTPFTLYLSRIDPKNIEVIGNIFDNPELLEGGESIG